MRKRFEASDFERILIRNRIATEESGLIDLISHLRVQAYAN
jgi:hypothetical protein